jgi:hypothetical protein
MDKRKSSQEMSPKKKNRYFVTFKNEWLKNSLCKDWIQKLDDYSALCSYCNTNFSIKYEGFHAIETHSNCEKHKKSINLINKNNLIEKFMLKKNSKEEEKVTAAEISLIYHSISHHHSYLSAECGIKLSQKLFNDSIICKKLSCGRTKSAAIAENILFPFSIEKHLKKLLNSNQKFSVSSDASNKGNRKMFPIAIQYFCVEEGIQNFILDFYEDANETSDAIFENLKTRLGNNNLNICDIIAYGADNASVNYGRHQSVFTKLLKENDKILKANCLCHVLHNTAKHGLIKYPLDVHNLVIKIYSHFSVSSKRLESLKSCYEFTDNTFSKIVKHIPTRWLTLFEGIKRLIANLNEIKSYFIGIDQEEVPEVIFNFIWERSEHPISKSEIYLHFSLEYMRLFNETILILEKRSTNSTQLYDIMTTLRGKLNNRIDYKFFGSDLNEKLQLFALNERKEIEKNLLYSYKKAINYLELWFDFNKSIYERFTALNLENPLDYNSIIEIVNYFNLDVDKNSLFDECFLLNDKLKNLTQEHKSLEIDKLWCLMLKNGNLQNLRKIVECVLAIPVSNAFVERVFSIMKNLWSDERNKLNVDLIKAEICIKINFNLSCSEFAEYIKTNYQLLSAAKSSNKYKF